MPSSFSSSVARAAPIAADGDLRAEDDRRRTRSGRSAAEDGAVRLFLAHARNGQSPGEESRAAAVAVRAIEA